MTLRIKKFKETQGPKGDPYSNAWCGSHLWPVCSSLDSDHQSFLQSTEDGLEADWQIHALLRHSSAVPLIQGYPGEVTELACWRARLVPI